MSDHRRAWGRSGAAVRFPRSSRPQIVGLCRQGDRVGRVRSRQDFDLAETAVRERVRQAERDAGTPAGRRSRPAASGEELAELRRENRRRREDVDILKRATAFFAKADPVSVYPFIEAEKAQRRNVKRACELLKVCPCRLSTSTWQGRPGVPGADADLTSQIRRRAQGIQGPASAPRGCTPSCAHLGHRHGRKRIARADAPGRARQLAGPPGAGRKPPSRTRPPQSGRTGSAATSPRTPPS